MKLDDHESAESVRRKLSYLKRKYDELSHYWLEQTIGYYINDSGQLIGPDGTVITYQPIKSADINGDVTTEELVQLSDEQVVAYMPVLSSKPPLQPLPQETDMADGVKGWGSWSAIPEHMVKVGQSQTIPDHVTKASQSKSAIPAQVSLISQSQLRSQPPRTTDQIEYTQTPSLHSMKNGDLPTIKKSGLLKPESVTFGAKWPRRKYANVDEEWEDLIKELKEVSFTLYKT